MIWNTDMPVLDVIDEKKPHHRYLVYSVFSLYIGQTM